MVGQHGSGKEEEWEVANVCRFHRFFKTCPKDPFLIPRIDQLVDAMIGHPQMSFLNAF